MDVHAAAILKPEKRRSPKRTKGKSAATLPHYGYGDPKKGWTGPVERIANPMQRSVILLVMCSCCRQYQLEGSHELGYCRTCGTVNG